MKLFYRVIEYCEESYFRADTAWGRPFLEFAAEDCAEDFYSNHDGYEEIWPLTITLHKHEGGREIGRFVVGMEVELRFSASQIKPA